MSKTERAWRGRGEGTAPASARRARWRLRYLEEDPTATRANSRPRRPQHLAHSKIGNLDLW